MLTSFQSLAALATTIQLESASVCSTSKVLSWKTFRTSHNWDDKGVCDVICVWQVKNNSLDWICIPPKWECVPPTYLPINICLPNAVKNSKKVVQCSTIVCTVVIYYVPCLPLLVSKYDFCAKNKTCSNL